MQRKYKPLKESDAIKLRIVALTESEKEEQDELKLIDVERQTVLPQLAASEKQLVVLKQKHVHRTPSSHDLKARWDRMDAIHSAKRDWVKAQRWLKALESRESVSKNSLAQIQADLKRKRDELRSLSILAKLFRKASSVAKAIASALHVPTPPRGTGASHCDRMVGYTISLLFFLIPLALFGEIYLALGWLGSVLAIGILSILSFTGAFQLFVRGLKFGKAHAAVVSLVAALSFAAVAVQKTTEIMSFANLADDTAEIISWVGPSGFSHADSNSNGLLSKEEVHTQAAQGIEFWTQVEKQFLEIAHPEECKVTIVPKVNVTAGEASHIGTLDPENVEVIWGIDKKDLRDYEHRVKEKYENWVTPWHHKTGLSSAGVVGFDSDYGHGTHTSQTVYDNGYFKEQSGWYLTDSGPMRWVTRTPVSIQYEYPSRRSYNCRSQTWYPYRHYGNYGY